MNIFNIKYSLALNFLISLLFLICPADAGNVRCELVRDSCLDLSQITHQSITVPSNTTRIDKGGFGICLPSLNNFQAVDLVIILDMSGSMVWTDREKLLSPASIAVLNLIDSLSPSSNVGFIGFADGICDGTKKNIDADKGKGKKFREKADTRVFPAPLSSPGHKEKLLDQMTFSPDNFLTDCGALPPAEGRGTNYYRPFLLAEEWFSQMDTPNKQIIVFLTDGGNNSEVEKYRQMLARVDSTNFPTVNAIFVNSGGNPQDSAFNSFTPNFPGWNPPSSFINPEATGENPELQLMTEKTNGVYAKVEDFTNVKEKMLTMVGAYLIPNAPEHTSISKNGSVISQTANHLPIEFTNFQVNLSHDLALDLGANQFSVSVKTSDFGDKNITLNIQASGPPEITRGKKDLGNHGFDAVCYDASTLSATDKNDFSIPISQLGAFSNDGFGITLKTPADDIKAVANVQAPGEMENISLSASGIGFQGLASYKNSILKALNNGTVEALAGETLRLSWAHPYDPRDTASAILSLFDDRADTTSIYFTNLKGDVITGITDLDGDKFKIVVKNNKATGPFAVHLTTSHNDILNVMVKNVGHQTFEAIVSFRFSAVVNPGNQIIEGIFNPASSQNQTTVTAVVKNASNTLLLRKIFTPLKNVWIIDGNGDGRADKIFIQFTEAIHKIPASISDIHWPNGYSEVKQASAMGAVPNINPISFVNNDRSLVLVDLSKDPFEFGATSASATSPPTLRLPDGRTPVIQDSVKPVLLKAEKMSSNFDRYIRASDRAVIHYPDTLNITLSESVIPFPGSLNPWVALLLLHKHGKILPVDILAEPKVLSMDGRTLSLLIDPDPDENVVKVGDILSLNPGAPYLDEKGNFLSGVPVQVTGNDGSKAGFASAWRGGAVNGDQHMMTQIEKGAPIPVIDDATGQILDYMPIAMADEWIPPAGFNKSAGEADFNVQTSGTCKDVEIKESFPHKCLASRVILTGNADGPYIAQIRIYDNMGKFVRFFRQAFGYCGEFENKERFSNTGYFVNDLVWNMRDNNGNLVGSGVYIWKISLHFQNGRIKKRIFNMGIIRDVNNPQLNCIDAVRTFQ